MNKTRKIYGDDDDGDEETHDDRRYRHKRPRHDDRDTDRHRDIDRHGDIDGERRSYREEKEDDETLNYEHYRNLLDEIYFTNTDPIKVGDENHGNFWIFLRKFQQFQKIKKSKQDSSAKNSYDKVNKINLAFSSKSDKIQRFDIKQEYGGKARKLTTEEIDEFQCILLHYYDFLQKQKFTKLRKIRRDQMNLPIYKYKHGIIDSIKNNQVVVVAGDTGCGKSTQVPQYLLEAGFTKISCTQPRRISCIALAKRVSHETFNEFGSDVAYQVRFDKTRTKATRILFLTEGLLLRQVDNDPSLSRYDVIIMDEVHERHIHTDFLLGVIKCVLHQRPDLKLILMSATINLELFSRYFDNAPVAKIPGRLYPIQLNYTPPEKADQEKKSGKFDPAPYIKVLQSIDRKYPPTERGDVLVFLSGMTEIMTLVEAAREYGKKSSAWIVLPLHSSLSLAEQDKVFDYPPDGVRKCIISTNIAETSITIDGVRFVVDSGKMKEMAHDSGVKMGSLKETWISRASAEQRKGRAGRTGPGVCFRLYDESDYKAMEEYSIPEIRRVPLESLVLQMVVLGIPDPRVFPFIESPPSERLESAVQLLKSQGALTDNETATQIGKTLARLPVDVAMGKMLIAGCLFETVDPILSIAASLCVQSIFTNTAHRDYEAFKIRKNLESNHGDPLTLLNILEAWLELKWGGDETRRWCKKRGVEEQRLYEVTKLRVQFKQLLTDHGLLDDDDDDDDSDDDDAGDALKRRQRHADKNQLRKLRLEHRNKERKKKVLKMNDGDDDDHDETDEREKVVGDVEGDIRDLEFRLTNDMRKIQDLVTNSRRATAKDTALLKVIVCSALHPQYALSDEHNAFKPDSQQLYHTPHKTFVLLHPTSVLATDPERLALKESDVKEGAKRSGSRHRGQLSHRHQLLAHVTLLETTKPYLINALRVPALQTLLLFSNHIDTSSDLHRLVFDLWIDIEIDQSEDTCEVVMDAIRLRTIWQKLLEHKLHWAEKVSPCLVEDDNCEDDKVNNKNKKQDLKIQKKIHKRAARKLMNVLSKELKTFLHKKVHYRIRRLHAAETNKLYRDVADYFDTVKSTRVDCKEMLRLIHPIKGGLQATEYLTYDCLDDDGAFPPPSSPLPLSRWEGDDYDDGKARDGDNIAAEYCDKFNGVQWLCPICGESNLSDTIEKLLHAEKCQAERSLSIIHSSERDDDEEREEREREGGSRKGDRRVCDYCHRELKYSLAEMIRHMKRCADEVRHEDH